LTGALLIEFHGWRGVALGRDLFLYTARLGFLTIGVSRLLVSDRLRQLEEIAQSLVRGAR
jgi:hypothetical protein